MPIDPEISAVCFTFTPDGFLFERGNASGEEESEKWQAAFHENKWQALYRAGFCPNEEIRCMENPPGLFLRILAERFVSDLTSLPELELAREAVRYAPTEEEIAGLLRAVPFAIGAEHVTEEWIRAAFSELLAVFQKEIADCSGSVASYFQGFRTDLRVPERVFFHLAENKNDAEYPFAFLATYCTRGAGGAVCHVPLKNALTEFGAERDRLIELLSCLNRAAEVSPLIAGYMRKGLLFSPLRITAQEAYDFLRQSAEIEQAGIVCRIPDWWRRRSYSVSMSVQIGAEKPAALSADVLLSCKPEITVDGVALSQADLRKLQKQTEGLLFLKGRWVEVNRELVDGLLKQMEVFEQEGAAFSLMDAIRLTAGIESKTLKLSDSVTVTNGKWLAGFMKSLRNPERLGKRPLPETFRGTLRPYQKTGYSWLCYMDGLGLGACLADDMGLGKTVQVLAYLEMLRTACGENGEDGERGDRGERGACAAPASSGTKRHALLVVPASLLGNWEKEAERFVPEMELAVLHGAKAAALNEMLQEPDRFLYITTYEMVSRLANLGRTVWDCILLDEAQAIKNPATAQTRAVKKLKGRMRIALTGTPIENNLGNLWSIFDFLDPGLLGSMKEFSAFVSGLREKPYGYDSLRTAIKPFLLRRVKTDKSVIRDLPDKVETIEYAGLTAMQIALYNQVTEAFEKGLREADGMERRGMILAVILKLKQICNHPAHYLGQGDYLPEESGKFLLLRDLCSEIREKRERVLVFTQFREIVEPLAAFLSTVFRCEGRVLHGGTPVAKRRQIVEEFQGDGYVPFLVLSLKAGGTGLNLTNACHVVHFDRWWNPAVENQATDRAFRIGQKKNVIVHKFLCTDTVEERIHEIIEEKKELAGAVIGDASTEQWITELSDDQLMSMLRLKR